jgi:hypothetical protein
MKFSQQTGLSWATILSTALLGSQVAQAIQLDLQDTGTFAFITKTLPFRLPLASLKPPWKYLADILIQNQLSPQQRLSHTE